MVQNQGIRWWKSCVASSKVNDKLWMKFQGNIQIVQILRRWRAFGRSTRKWRKTMFDNDADIYYILLGILFKIINKKGRYINVMLTS